MTEQFQTIAKSVLNGSSESNAKLEQILEIQKQLQERLFDVMDKALDGETLNPDSFNELFGTPLHRLDSLLTDDEFCKIFQMKKSDFQSMLESPFKTEPTSPPAIKPWGTTPVAIPGQNKILDSF